MNLLLCFSIIMLCGYMGRLLAQRATQQLEFFREFESAMVSLADSGPGMSLDLSRARETPCGDTVGPGVQECAQRLRAAPQRCFSEIWRECFQQRLQGFCGLGKEDMRVVMDAGEAIEALCRNPGRSQTSGYLKRLANYLADMEIDKRKKCRLFNAGGVLAGC
jgi:hypothetical protein